MHQCRLLNSLEEGTHNIVLKSTFVMKLSNENKEHLGVCVCGVCVCVCGGGGGGGGLFSICNFETTRTF